MLLQSCSRNQLAECLRSLSVAPGNLNRAQLEEVLHDKCQEPRVHEAVCRTLLGHFSTSGLRQWMLHLRKVGHNVEPSTSWGGFSKEILVAAFVRMDKPLPTISASGAAVGQPICEVPHQSCLEVALVPCDPSLRCKLKERWIRRARRRLRLEGKARRAEDRKEESRRVIAALKSVLPTSMDATVKEIRALVSNLTGIQLDGGVRRLFFDSQLLKLTRRVPKRMRKQRRPRFVLKVSGSAPAS
jgi:hypothetical protein